MNFMSRRTHMECLNICTACTVGVFVNWMNECGQGKLN